MNSLVDERGLVDSPPGFAERVQCVGVYVSLRQRIFLKLRKIPPVDRPVLRHLFNKALKNKAGSVRSRQTKERRPVSSLPQGHESRHRAFFLIANHIRKFGNVGRVK